MMYDTPIWVLGSLELPVYGILAVLSFCVSVAYGVYAGKKQGVKAAAMALYGLLAALLGLFLGRAIFTAVHWYDFFLDEMGEFAGLGGFFDLTRGSVSVVGFLIGVPLAAPIAARLTKSSAPALLDAAATPALVMYALCRLAEPLSGQGYGDFLGAEVCVCWLEAALTVLLMALIPLLRRKCRRPGTLGRYAFILWTLLQILPESLRCDNALFVLIFARVTHLGLACALGFALIRLLVCASRRGAPARQLWGEFLLFALGIAACIGTIFALDKTNWPKLLVYAMMIASLVELGWVILGRIRKEDQIA